MLEELKKELLGIAKEADSSGLCRHKSGNFSIRDKETGYIVVTPTGVDRKELSYHDICVVDIDANVIEIETKVKPTSEFLMHAAVYKTRRNVYSVVHTHSKFATAFAVIGKPIPSIVYECVNLNLKDGIVPVASYGTPGTTELSSSVIRPIKRADALLLESHGVLTVGENPRGAFLKACYVEELAEIYYRALMINGGKEPKVISVEEIQKWKYPSQIKLNK